LDHSYIPVLNLHKKSLANLKVHSSEIFFLDIDRTTMTAAHDLFIENCVIEKVFGVSGVAGLPSWISGADVIEFEQISNSAAIKQSDILGSNKLLLSVVHKIFFQRGSGREEGSLQKGGYGQDYSAKLITKILNLLMREGVVERIKGHEGWVYKPVRAATARMNKMRSELSLSTDSIWIEAAGYKD
jgi:hypothetical protein